MSVIWDSSGTETSYDWNSSWVVAIDALDAYVVEG